MATHSSVLAWRIPGTGEPGGLPSVGSHRVRHNWATFTFLLLSLSFIFHSYLTVWVEIPDVRSFGGGLNNWNFGPIYSLQWMLFCFLEADILRLLPLGLVSCKDLKQNGKNFPVQLRIFMEPLQFLYCLRSLSYMLWCNHFPYWIAVLASDNLDSLNPQMCTILLIFSRVLSQTGLLRGKHWVKPGST